jgi:hypothetical protein
MDLTVQQFVRTLRRAGLPEAAAMADRTLRDPVTPQDLDRFCTQLGLSRSWLVDRMGGSP